MKYYPPHVHTCKGSIGDSTLKIEDYIEKAHSLGLSSLCITNHGGLNDMYEFMGACKDKNIKPIIGCEVYLVEDRLVKEERKYNHLVLIARNSMGLTNLIDIVTDSNLNGKYYKPRTDLDYINSGHNSGLIALSGCIAGPLSEMILNNKSDEDIINKINELKTIFDDFYIEIMPGEFEEQKKVNNKLIELAKITNTKIIASNDVHYLNKEDYITHNMHVKMERKEEYTDDLVYPDTCYYFMSYEDICNAFKIEPEKDIIEDIDSMNFNLENEYNNDEYRKTILKAINNTELLVNSVEEYDIDTAIRFPEYPIKGYENIDIIRYLCYEYLNKIKDKIGDLVEYEERIEYELDAINELGFSSYFLVVKDYLDWAREAGIEVGPGRGSVCGSLVAYLLGITKIDPIKYNLLFERFLSRYRKGSVPDVDSDICSLRRMELFQYIINKYGLNNCSLVSTFGMRKAKGAIRDVGRALQMDAELIDTIAKLIPDVYYDNGEKKTDLDLVDSIEVVPELQEYKKQYPKLFDFAIKLEGLPRHTSIHAAGTIIAPVKLNDIVPLIESKNENILATALDLKSAESAGLIKYDNLGLSTLSVINELKRKTGDTFDYEFDNYDCTEAWNVIGSKYAAGLFQISSTTYKQRMHRLKPKNIKELANCLALLRSPCIMARQDELYMQILEGKQEIELIHPFYDDAVKDTMGILIYQEDLMQIMINCGFDMENSFKIMKALAKKKVKLLNEYKEQYYSKVLSKGMDQSTADKIWHIAEQAGLYLFNKGHAVAYAVLAYATAYYKVKHTKQFYASCLTDAYINDKDVKSLVKECGIVKAKLLPPDINKAEWNFIIDNDNIRIGFCAMKAFGRSAAAEAVAKRPFTNLEEMEGRITKKAFTKSAFMSAIFGGAFDEFFESRKSGYLEYMRIRNEDTEEEIKLNKKTIKVNANLKDFEKILYSAPLTEAANKKTKKIGGINKDVK